MRPDGGGGAVQASASSQALEQADPKSAQAAGAAGRNLSPDAGHGHASSPGARPGSTQAIIAGTRPAAAGQAPRADSTAQSRAGGPARSCSTTEIFLFLYFFFRFIKNIYWIFFCKNVTSRWFIRRKRDTAGPSGGRYITPVESAVGGRLDGPWWAGNLPPFQPAVAATYRRMSRR